MIVLLKIKKKKKSFSMNSYINKCLHKTLKPKVIKKMQETNDNARN